MPNAEILQSVKAIGDIFDGDTDGRIERIPDGVAELHDEPRRFPIERRRHLDSFARAEDKRAEHAADRLGEARRAVLRFGARVGIAAIPSRSAPEAVGCEAMNGNDGRACREQHKQKDQKAIVGAARFRDRNDGEEGHIALKRHAGANHCIGYGRKRIDEEARQDAGDEAERGETEHGGQREIVGLMRALGGFRARAPKKSDAERLDETGRGESGGERKQRAHSGDQEPQAP